MSSPKGRHRAPRLRASPAFQRGEENPGAQPAPDFVSIPMVPDHVAPRDHDHSICERALEIHKQDSNAYATTKTYGQGHLNISAIQLQISMLLFVSTTVGKLDGYQITLVVLICVALTTEFIIFVILAILAKSTTDKIGKGSCPTTATSLNALVTSMTGFLLILTTAITSVSVYAKVTGVVLPHTTNSTGG